MESMPEELAHLDQQLSEKRARELPRLEPGGSAMVVAVGMLVLLLSDVLPWTGHTTGWEVVSGAVNLGLLPRLFGFTSLLFGVLGSALALATRRWPIAWGCALGGGFSVVNGVWAVWSRQTAQGGGAGPGPGLVLALVAMALITMMWVRLAWTRPGGRANG
jgi:hypothetical protein